MKKSGQLVAKPLGPRLADALNPLKVFGVGAPQLCYAVELPSEVSQEFLADSAVYISAIRRFNIQAILM